MSIEDINSITKFSFSNFAKIVRKREVEKKSDTFVIIYGLPRTGKTTLGFNLLIPYLRLKKKLYKEGKSKWKIESRWSFIFDKYFASSCEEMHKKIKNNENGSFIFIDEGTDVMSWHSMMTKEQQDLLELLQKTGAKSIFTIFITPSLSLLTKDILTRAHYMFIVPSEPSKKYNTAMLLKNYTVPFLAEKYPFGLKNIIKAVEKYPQLIKDKNRFRNYLHTQDRFIGEYKFSQINQKLYDLYVKKVKMPAMLRTRKKRRMVSYTKYFKLKYMFDTILFNLYTKDNKSIAQINRLLIDKFGSELASRNLIQNHLDSMTNIQIRPKELDEKEEILEKESIKINEKEDISVDEIYDESN